MAKVLTGAFQSGFRATPTRRQRATGLWGGAGSAWKGWTFEMGENAVEITLVVRTIGHVVIAMEQAGVRFVEKEREQAPCQRWTGTTNRER